MEQPSNQQIREDFEKTLALDKALSEIAMPQQSTSSALKTGWICLSIGLLLMLIPFPLLYISGPLCGVAGILAIVGLAHGHTGRGIALLIASLVLSPLFWLVGLAVLTVMMH